MRGTGGLSAGTGLREGENLIEIRCETTRLDEGLVSPLYLAGDFSVNSDDSLSGGIRDGDLGICPFEDYRAMGLPYFSGRLLYSFDFDCTRESIGSDKVLIEVLPPVPFQEALEISLNGEPFLPAPWIPYRTIAEKASLKEGRNHIEIRVSTSLIRTFEGTRFDIERHRYEEC